LNRKMESKWIVDLKNLTCHNPENQMVVGFEKKGNTLEGKIKDIPCELFEKWKNDPNCRTIMKKAVIEADEVFFRAYFNKEIEKKCLGERLPA